MTRLILRFPNRPVREVEYAQPKYRIGRAGDNDLVLDHEEVAPYQAEIDEVQGAYTITDTSEEKSTKVNGKTIETINLNYGDRLAFGPVTALFYPEKKKKGGYKAKLLLYIGAGALVIVLSIVFIFFLMSRQIQSVVTGRINKGLIEESVSEEAPVASPPLQEKSPAVRTGIRLFNRPKEPSGYDRSQIRRSANVTVELPEPTDQEISKRTAAAVPRGLGRLFFRKTPIQVEKTIPAVSAEDRPEISRVESGEGEVSETLSAEVPAAAGETTGVFGRILSPLKRLFGTQGAGGRDITETSDVLETPAPLDEGQLETAQPALSERPLEVQEREETVKIEDLARLTEPLSVLTAMDIPALSGGAFEEKPLYGEGEVNKFESTVGFRDVPISGIETTNMDIAWKYPEGFDKIEPILRSGAVMRLDRRGPLHYLFGTKKGVLYALNGETGEETFVEDLGKPFYDPLVEFIDDDPIKDILIVFEDGDISVFSARLERLWHYDGSDQITAMPALLDSNSDGTKDIVFPTLNMDIIVLDGRTGFELWRFYDSESEIIHSPAAFDANDDSVDDVLVSTEMGYVYLLDGKTGWSLWKNPIHGRPAGSPSLADLDGDGRQEIVILTKDGNLVSFSPEGKLLFTYEIEGTFSNAPSLGDTDGDGLNEIVLTDDTGVIRVIEGKTRAEKWTFESEEGPVLGRTALCDLDGDGGMDVVYCSYSGALFVLDGRTGSQVAVFNSKSHVFSTPIAIDMNRDRSTEIICGTYSGEVYALNVSDMRKKLFALKRSSWGTRNHDYSNSGYARSYFLKNPWM
jgi:outer membrane protein assembly factor BamB